MNTRVKQLRTILNMSQGTFAARLGVTGPGISKIESGSRKLTEQMLLMICREFRVNENWLRYGEGEIFLTKNSDGMEELSQFYHLDELDRKIIYEYARLDEKKRNVIKEYIMRIAYGSSRADVLKDGNTSGQDIRCAEETDTY